MKLTPKEFKFRTGIDINTQLLFEEKIMAIVSLRDLAQVRCVQVMPSTYLRRLVESVSLVGNNDVRPFAGCKISRVRMDPRMLLVGQTFVENSKLLALDDFEHIFSGHDVPFGISKKGSFLIYGVDNEGQTVLAHYLPPIVEWTGGRHRLLDGLHRCYHTMTSGTTIEVLKIHHVTAAFPCESMTWQSVERVNEKPPKEKRFFGLQEDLFRDLKFIGIDG